MAGRAAPTSISWPSKHLLCRVRRALLMKLLHYPKTRTLPFLDATALPSLLNPHAPFLYASVSQISRWRLNPIVVPSKADRALVPLVHHHHDRHPNSIIGLIVDRYVALRTHLCALLSWLALAPSAVTILVLPSVIVPQEGQFSDVLLRAQSTRCLLACFCRAIYCAHLLCQGTSPLPSLASYRPIPL